MPVCLSGVDVGVQKTVDDATPAEAETIVYTMVATNNGPGTATGVAFTDVLPSGVTYVTNTTTQGSYNESNGVWTIGTLSNAATATLTLTATVDAGSGNSSITNTISLSAITETDTVSSNNTDSAVITVDPPPDLGVTKTVDDATPDEGQVITYTMIATNNGPGVMTGIELTDLLPSGVTYSNHNAGSGTYTASNGIWAIASLAVSNSVTLTITGIVDAGTAGSSITNNISLTASDQTDTITSNNTDSAVIVVNGADLCVSKSVNVPTPAICHGSRIYDSGDQ